MEWLYLCTSLSRKNSLYLLSREKLFSPLSRDVTRSTKTYSSAPRLQFHLSFAVCALFTLTKRMQEKTKKRKRTQSQRSALWDRQDKLRRGIFTVTSQPQGRERRGRAQCYATLIIYPQIFSGTCNPRPASQEHVCRV